MAGTPDAVAAGAERRRYRRILWFAATVFVQSWWFDLALPRIGLRAFAERGRDERYRRIALRFRDLAVRLGGLMIKVGQAMSSRLDVLPPELTDELATLQDEVPAAPFESIRRLAEAELGVPLDVAFRDFDPVPVAAASLGQAYRARLPQQVADDVGFTDVIVKVQRPGIDRIVDVDLAALRRVGGWASRVRFIADRVDVPALVEEFSVTSREEIDYRHEAAAAERFREDSAADAGVRAPVVVWERLTDRVLVLEDVTAMKISDLDALAAAGIDTVAVAQAFARAMFDQLFVHGFFHADPHPGNIFVRATGDGRFEIDFIDFGMMGEISDRMRSGLRHVMIAVAARDGAGLMAAASEVGVLMPGADTVALEEALTTLFSRFGGMGFAELRDVDPTELSRFADDFSDVLRELPLQLPENFLLVMRAMSITSGVCSTLDPRFNLWDAIEPYAAGLVRSEGAQTARDVAGSLVESAQIAWRLPRRADALITDVERGRVRVDTSRLEDRLDRLDLLARRILAGVLFAALLIAGALMRADDVVLGTTFMLVSALPLLVALFARGRRRPRRR